MPDIDLSTLSDEDLDKLLNGEETEESLLGKAATDDDVDDKADDDVIKEEKTDDDKKDDDVVVDDTKESDDKKDDVVVDDEPKKPSRRQELRVQQLIAKMKQKPEVTPATVTPNQLNYKDELEADDETIKKLEDDRKQVQDSAYERALTQARTMNWETTLNIDAPQVEGKYAYMNRNDAEHFHPGVADGLTKMYLDMVGYDSEKKTVENPSIRWSDFMESMNEMAEEIASTKVTAATQNIKKQASLTGIRPGGAGGKKLDLNKTPQDMTDEELDAVLAQSFPTR